MPLRSGADYQPVYDYGFSDPVTTAVTTVAGVVAQDPVSWGRWLVGGALSALGIGAGAGASYYLGGGDVYDNPVTVEAGYPERSDPTKIGSLEEELRKTCGPGEICEDFLFDMAAGTAELEGKKEEERGFLTGIASDLLEWGTTTITAVAKAVSQALYEEDKKVSPQEKRRMVRQVYNLCHSRKFVDTVRPVRDLFGPSTFRYRRGGYMRRSGAGYPTLG